MKTTFALKQVVIITTLLILFVNRILAQDIDTLNVLTTSSKVGGTIDLAEKRMYRILTFVPTATFDSARFLQRQDSSILLRIWTNNGEIRDRVSSTYQLSSTKDLIEGGSAMPGLAHVRQVKPRIPWEETKKWSISFWFGGQAGPDNTFESAFKEQGFGDSRLNYTQSSSDPIVIIITSIIGGFSSGSLYRDFPQSKKNGLPFSFQVARQLHPHWMISVQFGKTWDVDVLGYDNIGSGNFLKLNSSARDLGFQFGYHTGNGHTGLTLGPSLLFHQKTLSAHTAMTGEFSKRSVIPGLQATGSLSLISSKYLVLALNVHYKSYFGDSLGPYQTENFGTAGHGAGQVFTSTFDRQPVNLSTVQWGLNLGFKL